MLTWIPLGRTCSGKLVLIKIPDVLRSEDHKLAWSGWKSEIAAGFEGRNYTPAASRLIEMPKDGFLVRPLCLMHPRDRVAYRAIVDVIAPAMDDARPDTVFSYRLKHAKQRLTKQVSAWRRFQDAGRRLYGEYKYAYLLSTDVASYFEYVDVDTSPPPLPSASAHTVMPSLQSS